MPKTRALADCRQFCDEITSAGGTAPDVLQALLATADRLMAPAATQDPLRGLFDRALNGQVPDESEIDALIAEAAGAQSLANFRGSLAPRIERETVDRWHKTLQDGCADLILSSMRKTFDQHAKAIGVARSLIPRETALEQWLSTAEPAAVTAWQELGSHIAALTKIGNVASQFGARPLARFSLIREVAGDNFATDDRALFCACGGLAGDSIPFLQIDRGGRESAWMAVPLRLNTVAEARERYRAWCEGQWDGIHTTRTVQFNNPADGSASQIELKNPFRQQEVRT